MQRRPARPELGQRAVVRRRRVGERAAGVEEVAELARERRAALDTLLRAEALDRLAQPVGGGGLGRGRLGAAEVGEDRRAIVGRVALLERAPQVHRRRPRRAAAQGVGGGRSQRDRDLGARARARLQRVGRDALDGRVGRMEDPTARRCAAARSVAPISS